MDGKLIINLIFLITLSIGFICLIAGLWLLWDIQNTIIYNLSQNKWDWLFPLPYPITTKIPIAMATDYSIAISVIGGLLILISSYILGYISKL